MVAVGYPKGAKYENYRGNGERRLRRMAPLPQHPYQDLAWSLINGRLV
jgi:hypothetical protein